jgi:CheY-like chemotaxis protein
LGHALTNNSVDDDFDDLQEQDATSSRGIVLIAEDIKTNRLVLCSLLETLHIQVLQAVNGMEAVDAFKKNPAINFILMDVKMPVMDGVEATSIIREWEQVKDLERTPIIAVTAFDYVQDIKRCMDAGMDDVMYKPADLRSLSKVVDQYLMTKKIDYSKLVPVATDVVLKKILENRDELVFSEEWLRTFVHDHKKLASVILHGAMNDMPNYLQLYLWNSITISKMMVL